MAASEESSEKTPLAPIDRGKSRSHFSSTLSTVCSCIGLAVGTGNIWRFPRVVAASAGEDGALVFLIVWFMFLFLWSIPMLFIEYALGRYTQRAVVQAFHYMLGIKFLWSSLFVASCSFFIACYYTVIMGWSLYYLFQMMLFPLPETQEESAKIFYGYTDVGWPVLTQFICLVLTAGVTVRGVKTIEKANIFLTPAFLVIIIGLFIWSLTKENAMKGISFLFSPDWKKFADPKLYVEALSQNAFDTGAGSGIFIAYSSYIPATEPIAKYAFGIPLSNNLISLICGMTSFATVFSSQYTNHPNTTNAEILEILQTSGPGGSGIAFIWYPVLLSSAGQVAGRVIGVVFYTGLMFAGLSSNIPNIENACRNLIDLGVRRRIVLPVVTSLIFIVGVGSAVRLDFLVAQDFTWGFALLLTGLALQLLVIVYGSQKFREVVINGQSPHDLQIPRLWEWMIKYVTPIEALVVIGWWVVNTIIDGDSHGHKWYEFGPESVVTVLIQWIGLLAILAFFNLCVYKCQPNVIVIRLNEGQFDDIGEVGAAGESSKVEDAGGLDNAAVIPDEEEVEMSETAGGTKRGETGSNASETHQGKDS